jgi:tape measure domain-containing protein
MADRRLDIVLAAKDMTAKGFAAVQGRIASIGRSVISLQGSLLALAGVGGFGALGKSMIDTAASFEKLEIKLNGLTKGKGKETLERLNDLAIDLPVNTRELVDTFAMMTAMGLKPMEEEMLTLVDVASVFGQETLPRVARALGQMQTLGRLSAEELNQLSEAGIDARKYLTQAFGMTVEDLKKSQISIEEIIDAIWKGLNADFGGQAKAAMDSWDGMVTQFKSNWMELERQVANAGIFELLKDNLSDVNQRMSDFIKNNDELIRQNVAEAIDVLTTSVQRLASAYEKMTKVRDFAWKYFPPAMIYRNAGKLIDEETARANQAQGYYSGMFSIDNRASEAEFRGKEMAGYGGAAGYPFGGPAPSGGDGAAADAVLRSMGLGQDTEDKIDAALSGYIDAYRDFLDEQKTLNSEYLIAIAQGQGLYKFDPEQARFEGGQGQEQYVNELIANMERSSDAMKTMAEETSWSMQGAFANFFDVTSEGFLSLESLVQGVGQSITRALADALSKQVVGSTFSFLGLASAHGNVFSGGRHVPFAKGGIVSRPTVFPFASGIGLMGEAGPEAIMPLTRTPGGDLGVKSQGGGGNTYVNIQAADAKSFSDMVRRNPGAIIKTINQAIAYNGSTRAVIRGTT